MTPVSRVAAFGKIATKVRTQLARPSDVAFEFFSKGINHSNRILHIDPVFQVFRKQRPLAPINPLDEAPRPIPPPKSDGIAQHESNNQVRFHTARVIGDLVGWFPWLVHFPFAQKADISIRRLRSQGSASVVRKAAGHTGAFVYLRISSREIARQWTSSGPSARRSVRMCA